MVACKLEILIAKLIYQIAKKLQRLYLCVGLYLSNGTSSNDVQPNPEQLEMENPRWQPLNLKYLYLAFSYVVQLHFKCTNSLAPTKIRWTEGSIFGSKCPPLKCMGKYLSNISRKRCVLERKGPQIGTDIPHNGWPPCFSTRFIPLGLFATGSSLLFRLDFAFSTLTHSRLALCMLTVSRKWMTENVYLT